MRLIALDALPDGVWLTTLSGEIIYRNAVAVSMESLRWWHSGKALAVSELVSDTELLQRLQIEGEAFCEYQLAGVDAPGESERSIGMDMQLLKGSNDLAIGLLFHARDVSHERIRERFLQDRHIELEYAYARVKETQTQLLQSEKMASIGQLAAGVAHEINNPIGYIHSNMGTMQTYARGLLTLLEAYDRLAQSLPDSLAGALQPIEEIKSRVDYEFLRQDLLQLVDESREGIERVRRIVVDLRDFSHAGNPESDNWVVCDIHRGLQSTINIVWNELKYKTELIQDFGELPMVECIPSQLNQVFLNLLVNAGHSIPDRGTITIRTRHRGDEVILSFSDTGTGISPENLKRIFDPFFTTKAIGAGTGLGLALSYGIVQKHNGRIDVESVQGEGSTFHVILPVRCHADAVE